MSEGNHVIAEREALQARIAELEGTLASVTSKAKKRAHAQLAYYLQEYERVADALRIPDDYDTIAERADRLLEEVRWDRDRIAELEAEVERLRARAKQWQKLAVKWMPEDRAQALIAAVFDECADDIDAMSDKEIDAELRAQGLDPAEVARRMRENVNRAIARAKAQREVAEE